MAGLWNRKFDYANGEQRICKECGISFYTIKPRYSCNACLNIKQKVIEQNKRAKYEKKDNYPFNTKTHEAGRRFCSIRTALSNAWKQYKKLGDKTYVTNHYDKQLKEIQENGIMKWILDRRDMETLKEKKAKTISRTRKEYPNHHDYYEY